MHRLLMAFAALCAGSAAAAEVVVYGLVGNDQIVTFDPSSPGTITSARAIAGLTPGQVLTGIDIRPLDGLIYTVATDRSIYRLDLVGGSYSATLMGLVQGFPPPGPAIPIIGNNFGIDVAPFDRIRLVSDLDQSLRINPLNGGAAVDAPMNDGAGSMPFDIIGVAYPDSFPSSLNAMFYGIDGVSSSLVRSLGVPGGVMVKTNLAGDPFSPLGIGLTSQSQVGFDILFTGGTNTAFLSANDNFYTVDLNSGRASLLGALGTANIRGITVGAIPEPASWALMIIGFGAIGIAVRMSRGEGRPSREQVP